MIKNFLHLRAPGNWLNDPNGFIWYKGMYHLFYQYFPYGSQWGTMHWGHAVSKDLVNWEHLGIALFPSKRFDRNGCFSGSAIENGGNMNLYYTGVRYPQLNPENIHLSLDGTVEASQGMIVSEDGFSFDNFNRKTEIIPVIEDLTAGHPGNTRDPKVWKGQDAYYMILASQKKNQKGQEAGCTLFYKSGDGSHWDYVSAFEGYIDGYMWECPDLFPCGDKYVLAVSPMGYVQDDRLYREQSVCVICDFDEASCCVSPEGPVNLIDYGMDFYAPQSNVDAHGRRTMIGWMRMPEAVTEKGSSWIGMMSLPRLVEVENGHVCFRMHPEADQALGTPADVAATGDYSHPFRIRVTVSEGSRINIGGFDIRLTDGCVKTDRSRVYDIAGGRIQAATPPVPGRCSLDIVVDQHIIEIFVNDGYYVLSQIVYGLEGPVVFENTEGKPEILVR